MFIILNDVRVICAGETGARPELLRDGIADEVPISTPDIEKKAIRGVPGSRHEDRSRRAPILRSCRAWIDTTDDEDERPDRNEPAHEMCAEQNAPRQLD